MTIVKNLSGEVSKIAIIGLGYVGLPLAVEFSKKYKTIGFDLNKRRIDQLKKGLDITNEVEKKHSPDGTFEYKMIKGSEKINRTTYEEYGKNTNDGSTKPTSDK